MQKIKDREEVKEEKREKPEKPEKPEKVKKQPKEPTAVSIESADVQSFVHLFASLISQAGSDGLCIASYLPHQVCDFVLVRSALSCSVAFARPRNRRVRHHIRRSSRTSCLDTLSAIVPSYLDPCLNCYLCSCLCLCCVCLAPHARSATVLGRCSLCNWQCTHGLRCWYVFNLSGKTTFSKSTFSFFVLQVARVSPFLVCLLHLFSGLL